MSVAKYGRPDHGLIGLASDSLLTVPWFKTLLYSYVAMSRGSVRHWYWGAMVWGWFTSPKLSLKFDDLCHQKGGAFKRD